MERIILFGAGASYGAGCIKPKAPPLGKDLFEELVRYSHQSWGKLPADIRCAFETSFEQGMQVLWDKYSSNIALLMRHMTLYLAQFGPDHSRSDLYTRLLSDLKNRNATSTILFSTLNYECILELAGGALGMKIEYSDGAADSDTMRVWKLHGSCNFLLSGIRVQGRRKVTFTRSAKFDGRIRFVSPNEAVQYCLSNTGLYPAMALYMNAKPIQIGYSVIQRLQRLWGENVRKAKRVLVIGVRPYPEDAHIWRPLTECAGELGFIGPKEAFNQWKEENRVGKPSRWIGSRWNGCFGESVSFITEE